MEMFEEARYGSDTGDSKGASRRISSGHSGPLRMRPAHVHHGHAPVLLDVVKDQMTRRAHDVFHNGIHEPEKSNANVTVPILQTLQ